MRRLKGALLVASVLAISLALIDNVARSFIRFLTVPAAAPELKSMGIEPFFE